METKQLKYLSGPGPNMLSECYPEVWVGPGLVHPPRSPWTGFGHWGRASLASAQCPMGRVGKPHGDRWRKTFVERAVRSRDSFPCSGHCLSAPSIVPRLALGPTEPGTTSTPSHPRGCLPSWTWHMWQHLGKARLWLTPVTVSSPAWLSLLVAVGWVCSGREGIALPHGPPDLTRPPPDRLHPGRWVWKRALVSGARPFSRGSRPEQKPRLKPY